MVSSTLPARKEQKARYPGLLLLFVLLITSCGQASTSNTVTPTPGAPTVSTTNLCEAQFLALEGLWQEGARITAHVVGRSGNRPLRSATLPAGFRVGDWVWLGGQRVALSASARDLQDLRSTKYLVWTVDFATGDVIKLTEGTGAAPFLGALSGNRLVLGSLGRNVITDDASWRPFSFGDQTWEALDAKGDAILVRVGTGPRAEAYLLAIVAGDKVEAMPLAIEAEGLLLAPRDLYPDLRAGVAGVMLTANDVTLWRVAPKVATIVMRATGRSVVFGADDTSLVLVTQRDGSELRVLIQQMSGPVVESVLTRAAFRAGGSVIFAGSEIAVGLESGDAARGVEAYEVTRRGTNVQRLGEFLPVGALKACP